MELIKPGERYCDARLIEMIFLFCLPRSFWRFCKAAELLENNIHGASLAPFDTDLRKHDWLHWGLIILKEGPLADVPIRIRYYEEVAREAQYCLSCIVTESWNWRKAKLEKEGNACDNDPLSKMIGSKWKGGKFAFFRRSKTEVRYRSETIGDALLACSATEPCLKEIDQRITELVDRHWMTFAPDAAIPDSEKDQQFDEIVARFCIAVQSNTREIKGDQKKRRYRVLPAVKGCGAHDCIKVEPNFGINVFVKEGSPIRIPIAEGQQWEIMNRFLLSLKSGDDHTMNHFPVNFDNNDFTRCKGGFRAFVRQYIERQPTAHKDKNAKYEPYARFRVELLKT